MCIWTRISRNTSSVRAGPDRALRSLLKKVSNLIPVYYYISTNTEYICGVPFHFFVFTTSTQAKCLPSEFHLTSHEKSHHVNFTKTVSHEFHMKNFRWRLFSFGSLHRQNIFTCFWFWNEIVNFTYNFT